jgi:Protein of unknown function (DUF3631)
MARDDKAVVPFRPPSLADETAEDRARRLTVEVERLSRMSPAEWLYYVESAGYAEKYGTNKAALKKMIEATIKAAEKVKTEEQRITERVEKKQDTERREQQRATERQQQREQQRADREARDRQRERDRVLAEISKLPRAEHESRLAALAGRLGEDLEFLRNEFAQFVSAEEEASVVVAAGDVDLWPEPVDIKSLLAELTKQIRRYVALYDEDAVNAVVLWVVFAWLHDKIAVYSPMLLIKSADVDSGKTTLSSVISFLTPRAHRAAAITGPSLFRLVDHLHPTLIIDNADVLFKHKPDLVEIVSASWTRGHPIPRVVHGQVHFFDPFCPKIITGVNPHMDKQTRSRCIPVTLLPRLSDKETEDFKHVDNDDFIALRRKLARWTADNTAALGTAHPKMEGFNNRAAKNWCLQLAIADFAGGSFWPKQARKAAIKLSLERRDPSEGQLLLDAFWHLFAKHGPDLTSANVRRWLTADPTGVWADFRGKGPISERQIAVLLGAYEIHPAVIHPRGHAADRGYKVEWFEIAFKHHSKKPPPCKRTNVRKRRR